MHNETETVITISAADMAEGFFRWGTSYKPHFDRLCRRVGRARLQVRESRDSKGAVTWWECRVPVDYLDQRGLGVKTRGRVAHGIAKRGSNPFASKDSGAASLE